MRHVVIVLLSLLAHSLRAQCAATTVQEVIWEAQQLHGDAAIDDALRMVRVEEKSAGPRTAQKSLAALGFHRLLDLQLLAGNPEAHELMEELRSRHNELSIADRAKIRLLIGREARLVGTTDTGGSACDVHLEERVGSTRVHRRHLQAQADGLSPDTVAVVLSVLLGVGGYLIQAWSSSKGNRHAAELQREHEEVARLRQQDHERALAQMRRTDRWVNDLCSPVLRGITEYMWSRMKFVTFFARNLETSQPEAFGDMYDNAYLMKSLDEAANGTITCMGQILIGDSWSTQTQTTTGSGAWQSIHVSGSNAAIDIFAQDVLTFLKFPYVRELPEHFFEVIASDLNGDLASAYREYIRHEVKPALERIKDVVHTHYAAIEIPPLGWLIEKFPCHGKLDTPNLVADITVAYTRGWERVLARWDIGLFDVLYPTNHMMPLLAMIHVFNWSRQRGEAKQLELVGMVSGRKDDTTSALDLV